LARSEAVAILGSQRVAEIEYARQALAQDVALGLASLSTAPSTSVPSSSPMCDA
jgi:hypothetical protein